MTDKGSEVGATSLSASTLITTFSAEMQLCFKVPADEEERDRSTRHSLFTIFFVDQTTSEYADFVSDRFKTEFNIVRNDHHICPPSIPYERTTSQFRRPRSTSARDLSRNCLRIGGSKGVNKTSYGKGCTQPETHTFTATIEHVKILQSPAGKTSLSSPVRLKVLPRSPAEGKESTKHTEPDLPKEDEVATKKRKLHRKRANKYEIVLFSS